MGEELKCGFDPSRNKWTFGSGWLLSKELRRKREEMAWKRRRIRTGPVIVLLDYVC